MLKKTLLIITTALLINTSIQASEEQPLIRFKVITIPDGYYFVLKIDPGITTWRRIRDSMSDYLAKTGCHYAIEGQSFSHRTSRHGDYIKFNEINPDSIINIDSNHQYCTISYVDIKKYPSVSEIPDDFCSEAQFKLKYSRLSPEKFTWLTAISTLAAQSPIISHATTKKMRK